MAFPPTNPGLIARLQGASDPVAWEEFVAIYRPAITGFARRRGLTEHDAEDVAQEVLSAVASRIDQFVPAGASGGRARFSTWLCAIASHKAVDELRRRLRPADNRAVPLATIPDLEDRSADSRLLRDEVRRRCFHAAAADVRREVSGSTWQSFWQTAIEGVDPADIATRLGVTVGGVYAARARVTQRLLKRIGALEGEWTADDLAALDVESPDCHHPDRAIDAGRQPLGDGQSGD